MSRLQQLSEWAASGQSTGRWRSIAALTSLALVLALMGVFARYLSSDLTVMQQVSLRLAAAAGLSVVLLGRSTSPDRLTRMPQRQWLVLGFRAACLYLVAVPLFTKAVLLTKLGNVAFVSAVPLIAMIGAVAFGDQLGRRQVTLAIVCALGVFLVVAHEAIVWGTGELYALAANGFFALGYLSRRWHATLPDSEISILTLVMGAALTFAASAIAGEGFPSEGLDRGATLVILISGLFNVLIIYLSSVGFRQMDGAQGGTILALEPVFGVILGLVAYGEEPSVRELIGGVLIIASALGMGRSERSSRSEVRAS